MYTSQIISRLSASACCVSSCPISLHRLSEDVSDSDHDVPYNASSVSAWPVSLHQMLEHVVFHPGRFLCTICRLPLITLLSRFAVADCTLYCGRGRVRVLRPWPCPLYWGRGRVHCNFVLLYFCTFEDLYFLTFALLYFHTLNFRSI